MAPEIRVQLEPRLIQHAALTGRRLSIRPALPAMTTDPRQPAQPAPRVGDQPKHADRAVMKSNGVGHTHRATPAEPGDPPPAYPAWRTALLTAAVLLLCLLYAIVRYNLLGPVPIDQAPLYLANKAISLASLILIALAFTARRLGPGSRLIWVRHERRALGMTGLALALLHTALSLMILNPTYFAKFYNDLGQFTAPAGVSMLTGGVALVLLIGQGRVKAGGEADRAARRKLRLGAIGVLTLTAAHVLCMGLPLWLTPGTWHGHLPPITLISFALALIALGVGLLKRK